MKNKDDIIPTGLDLGTWTEEDQAAIKSPEWREVANAEADAVEAEMRGAPDTTIQRLRCLAAGANARLNAIVRKRLAAVATVARKLRAARSARRTRRAKTKVSPPSDDPPAGVDAVIGTIPVLDNPQPFLAALAELIADALLKETVT